MAKPILFLTAVFMSLCLMSCDLETDGNGKLDGFWHLERIDTLATGGSLDTSGEKMFWSFQVRLLMLQGGSSSFYFRFEQEGDSLTISSPYTSEGHEETLGEGGNKPVTDPAAFSDYGIEALETHYKKEALDGSRMILRSRRLRLMFRKF